MAHSIIYILPWKFCKLLFILILKVIEVYKFAPSTLASFFCPEKASFDSVTKLDRIETSALSSKITVEITITVAKPLLAFWCKWCNWAIVVFCNILLVNAIDGEDVDPVECESWFDVIGHILSQFYRSKFCHWSTKLFTYKLTITCCQYFKHSLQS